MKRYLLLLGVCVVSFALGGPAPCAAHGRRAQAEAGIGAAEAVQIAKQRAARKYKRLDRYNVAVCDVGASWRVVFELKDPRSDGRGPEYTIMKNSGAVIHVEVAAHRLPPPRADAKKTGSPRQRSLSREEAIALAKEDALKTFGPLTELGVDACELIGAWYVAFYFKEPLTRGGPPLYIIDKKTGRIIENRFYA
ncbi:MAG TPA: hypothetical protein VF659_12450 [Pyrinomonadaceae bacterium]|jgi:hypothetical protein